MSEYRKVEIENAPGPHHITAMKSYKDCMLCCIKPLYYRPSYQDFFDGNNRKISGLEIGFMPSARDVRDKYITMEYDPVTRFNEYSRVDHSHLDLWHYSLSKGAYSLYLDLFNSNEYIDDQQFKVLHELARSVYVRGCYNLDANDPKTMLYGYYLRLRNAKWNLFNVATTQHTSKRGTTYYTYEITPADSKPAGYTNDVFLRHQNAGLEKTRLGNDVKDQLTELDVAEIEAKSAGLPGFYHVKDGGRYFDIYDYSPDKPDTLKRGSY